MSGGQRRIHFPEAAGPPDDLAALTVGMRIRGPRTALTAVQLLVGEALALLEGDRADAKPEAARRVRAARDLCAKLRVMGDRRRA